MAAIRQRDAVDLPLVILGRLAVSALFNHFRDKAGLTSFQRVAKLLDGFIGLRLGPQNMHYFGKVPANQVRHISKCRQRRGVRLPNAEVGVNQVNAKGSFIDEGLELDGAMAQRFLGLLALGHVARHREQACRLAARIRNRRNCHIPPLVGCAANLLNDAIAFVE